MCNCSGSSAGGTVVETVGLVRRYRLADHDNQIYGAADDTPDGMLWRIRAEAAQYARQMDGTWVVQQVSVQAP